MTRTDMEWAERAGFLSRGDNWQEAKDLWQEYAHERKILRLN